MSIKPKELRRAVIVGGGVIGGSWAALFLANGYRVTLSDPDPDIESKVTAFLKTTITTLEELGFHTQDLLLNVSFEKDLQKAVSDASVIQECGPERVEFKRDLWRTIESAAPPDAMLLSSSSGIPASVQSAEMKTPGRLVVGHPFNPPHLMPLVEVVPSPKTSTSTTQAVMDFYKSLGKFPLHIRKELQGFVANRLQAAFFQECIYLVKEDLVTLNELDDAVTQSLGLRWATSGPFLSFHLGGGPGGLAHFMDHIGVGMEALWPHLGRASFDAETKKLLNQQIDASYGSQKYEALSEIRDEKEVAIIGEMKRITGGGATSTHEVRPRSVGD